MTKKRSEEKRERHGALPASSSTVRHLRELHAQGMASLHARGELANRYVVVIESSGDSYSAYVPISRLRRCRPSSRRELVRAR
jgi:hypothetical protein